jgi:hypothetical protein
MPETLVHPFESAGLGRAPFRFIGVDYRVGPIRIANRDGTETQIGAPGQPMGTCEFCGQGIAECCMIQDADGKRFVVGNVCVAKTNDPKLIDETKRAVGRAALERKRERDRVRIVGVRAKLERDEALRRVLRNQPHPLLWQAKKGQTMLDWCEWMLKSSGVSGSLKVCRAVEKAAEIAAVVLA